MPHNHCLPENQTRTLYRSACPRHVVTYELDMPEDDRRHMFRLNEAVRQAGNSMAGLLSRRIAQMKRTKAYRALQKDYAWNAEHLKKLEKDSPAYKACSRKLSAIGKKMSAMQKAYGVTWEDVRKSASRAAADYSIPYVFALTRAEDIWRGAEKILYQGAESIGFRRWGDFPVMRAKRIDRQIMLGTTPTGELEVRMTGFAPMRLIIPRKDWFLTDEAEAILRFLEHPEQEAEAVADMEQTGEVVPVFRPCYCAIECRKIRRKLRVYVQIAVSAPPVRKLDRFGCSRYVRGTGRVGNDVGTQSVASVSGSTVELENLAERRPGLLEEHEHRKRILLQKMDRSRRAMNPDRYNKDGTYKKGSHGPWKRSNAYRRAAAELKELFRRDAASRLYANRELANHMRSLGDVIIVEPPNANALAKRSKKGAERQDKVSTVRTKDGRTKEVRKFRRKKRFGRSVGRRSPAGYQAELKKKFGSGYHEVPGKTYRASQYDPFKDDYAKKKLSERWHHLPDGRKVQRDIMSAFLLYCADDQFETIDRGRCLAAFDTFWELHRDCIAWIVQNHLHICNSGITV